MTASAWPELADLGRLRRLAPADMAHLGNLALHSNAAAMREEAVAAAPLLPFPQTQQSIRRRRQAEQGLLLRMEKRDLAGCCRSPDT